MELPTLLDEYVTSPVPNHDGTERLITGSQTLRQRHEVRSDSETLTAEPMAQATKSADHLIGHQQNPIVIADPLDLRPIGIRRNDDPSGSLYRLANEGGNITRPQPLNLLLQSTGSLQAIFLGR